MAYFRISGLAPHVSGTATSANVLSEYSAILGEDDVVSIGTMPNNSSSVSQTINCGEQYEIPLGYHDGTKYVKVDTLANQTSGNQGDVLAEAKYILHGETAWVKGKLIKGTATFTIE